MSEKALLAVIAVATALIAGATIWNTMTLQGLLHPSTGQTAAK